MKKSKHGIARCNQRGIPETGLSLILEIGTPTDKRGNVIEYRITRRDRNKAFIHLKKLQREIDGLTGAAVLIAEDGTLVTTYRKH